ncbi:response regulator [Niveispirillum sp. SYP-B3756]|uniref:response regulator transcription factor n=1 Tax=Niveispirillum sp. SYP-B3756 TaxID=2662178 RepID=UPI001290D60E|nr:response regulator transcription factor [Niveispirillum sp. SYP-B3756]MQP67603.1 response regulator [Niveispirillum sp. SYP-B3756]
MNNSLIMLVDHDQLFSAALAALLEEKGLEVEPPVPSIEAALEVLEGGFEPAMIITDPVGFNLNAESHALQRLREHLPEVRLLVLSSDLSQEALARSLAVGAHGHVSKGASFNAVLRAVRLVLQGQAIYPAAAAQILGQSTSVTANEQSGTGSNADLSPREMQILACVLSGHSNKAIARRLVITESTVKMHFKNAMRKINASNRTQAAIWAMEHGIAPMA